MNIFLHYKDILIQNWG